MTLKEEYEQLQLICTAINNYMSNLLDTTDVEYEDERDKLETENLMIVEEARCKDILNRIYARIDQIQNYFKEIKEYYSQDIEDAKKSAIEAINLIDIKRR